MYQRIVIKLGTSVLTGGTPHFNRAHMVELVRQCAELYGQGKDIIICTSGAIAELSLKWFGSFASRVSPFILRFD
jgi:glutamate 5-kinase